MVCDKFLYIHNDKREDQSRTTQTHRPWRLHQCLVRWWESDDSRRQLDKVGLWRMAVRKYINRRKRQGCGTSEHTLKRLLDNNTSVRHDYCIFPANRWKWRKERETGEKQTDFWIKWSCLRLNGIKSPSEVIDFILFLRVRSFVDWFTSESIFGRYGPAKLESRATWRVWR